MASFKSSGQLGVVFDMDGTLYHKGRLRAIVAAYLAMSAIYRPLRTIRDIRIILHYRRAQELLRKDSDNKTAGVNSQVARTVLSTGGSAEEVTRCITYWMEQLPLRFLRVCRRKEITRTILRWREWGVPMAVYSDYPVGEKLRYLGLGSAFSVALCSTDKEVGRFKPCSRGYEVVAARLGIPPSHLIYVGDRAETDIAGAVKCGMQAILIGVQSPAFAALDASLAAVYRPQERDAGSESGRGTFSDYVSIARPRHWFKNVAMLPGVLLGWHACAPEPMTAWGSVTLGILATSMASAANYTINELLDATQDGQHPDKKYRPAAVGRIRPAYAYLQWALLAVGGLALSWWIGLLFFGTTLILLVMGLAYNAWPLRLKDRPYLDVLAESMNNPLRLLAGWYAVGCVLIPPASLVLSYWMLGGFFMAVKRFAELRYINNNFVAAAYRKSFSHYTEERLLISILLYAISFGLLAGVFVIRYRVELILSIPLVVGLMGFYLRLGLEPNSPTQRPEELYKHRAFMIWCCVTAAIVVICLIVRVPALSRIFEATIPTES